MQYQALNTYRIFCIALLSLSLQLWSQSADSLRFMPLLQPVDTLGFDQVYEGVFGETPEVRRNELSKSHKLQKNYLLTDSIPEHHIYLYSQGGSNANEISEFILSFQHGDTALITSFKTYLPASLVNFNLVSNEAHPIIQLDYVEYQSNSLGSTEMSMAAFFILDGFCLPLTRVLKKLWLSENGSYDAKCKDFQYFSVEFSREVSYKDGFLKLGSGHYKFSENLNCEALSQSHKVPSGKYLVQDYLVLKQ